MGYIY
jgi:group I intron endonuclease